MVTLQEIKHIITRLSYPASKDDLIDEATRQGVPTEAIIRLQQLPDDHYYGSADTVMDVLNADE